MSETKVKAILAKYLDAVWLDYHPTLEKELVAALAKPERESGARFTELQVRNLLSESGFYDRNPEVQKHWAQGLAEELSRIAFIHFNEGRKEGSEEVLREIIAKNADKQAEAAPRGVNAGGAPHPAMLALESLTPGGSEYVGDIKRCVEAVRETRRMQMEQIVKLTKRVHELEAKGTPVNAASLKLPNGMPSTKELGNDDD